ncbi:type IX secretion system membrane protein PorP/SprF [Tamlana haliotis]|uniref:Type IX secretion system membrane protein PorP/SprF n=1 Tax=Pseudotamlana haliotis TaxID=2614804 RepID=A0A6N6MKR3_9FLAO|nr:type IX secretion system membrane protein PorP/SprF [Tamlana haliotis]KAB1069725.1 type IX secretion system membrane protein PorP/SprF [Tamlana haliotis]
MKFKTFMITLFVVINCQVFYSQEGMPIYADYLSDNYYLIHPSMAGAANCAKIRVTARQQWFGQEDAPKLLTMSVNSKIGESNSAIGGIVYADNNGYHSQKGAYATYAHHLMFSRSTTDLNMLSFGLSAGFLQYQLDERDFLNDVPVRDPIIDGVVQSETNFNLDFGFSYHYLDFYAHATVKNLLNNSGVNNDLQITSNLRRFLFSTGYVYNKMGSSWAFEPSVLYQYKSGTKESIIDLNAKAYKTMEFGQLWAGLSYRQSLDGAEYLTDSGSIRSQKLNQITPIVGVNYNKFMFAYTYTYQTNDVVFTNGGFHQLSLGYNFNCAPKRYQCLCPAVN